MLEVLHAPSVLPLQAMGVGVSVGYALDDGFEDELGMGVEPVDVSAIPKIAT
jgi:hypothetical protein